MTGARILRSGFWALTKQPQGGHDGAFTFMTEHGDVVVEIVGYHGTGDEGVTKTGEFRWHYAGPDELLAAVEARGDKVWSG